MRYKHGRKRPNPDSLACRLIAIRNTRGLSQRDLAAKSGVSPTAVAEIETGVRRNPQLATLERLARALGVLARDLMPLGIRGGAR